MLLVINNFINKANSAKGEVLLNTQHTISNKH